MSTHTHAQSGAFSPSPVSQDASQAAQVGPWTPAHHVRVNKAKPTRLVELGTGPHGKNARFEFPEGWTRTIDLVTEADAWHPLFDTLPQDDQERLRRYLRAEKIQLPNGTFQQPGPLSFTTTHYSKRRTYCTHHLFDVPAQNYTAGQVTGLRCAAEMLAALKVGHGPHIDVAGILAEVIRADSESNTDDDRSGAAAAFLEVTVQALTFMAKHGNHAEFIAQKVAIAERRAIEWDDFVARDRAKFIQRMQEGRRKKREARQKAGIA